MFKFDNCKFYLVNLDKDVEKFEESKKELDSIGISAERLSAVNVNIENINTYKEYPVIPQRFTTPGQVGCFLSHYEILKQNINSEKDLCIFEDDIEFCVDFRDRIKYIEDNFDFEDWDILFLSSYYHLNSNPCWNTPEYKETGIKYIHQTYSSFCTHSYIVNKKSIKKLLNFLENKQQNYYAIDHAYILFQIENTCYSFTPGCVNQKPGISTISSISNDFKDQYKIFSEICGKHIFHKESLQSFDYYSYFFKDLYSNILYRQKRFNTEYGNYTLNLEEFIFSDYNISPYESDELQEYKAMGEFCKILPKNSIILDIGANYGLSSFAMAARGYQILAFEPVNINYYLLNKSIEENSDFLQNRIKAYKFAISDKTEKTKIFIPCFRDNCSMGQQSAIANMTKTKDYIEEEIEAIKLDDWILYHPEIHQNDIKFIKIDTQGFEYPIIFGMQNFIESSKNLYILLEWDPPMTEKAGYNSKELYFLMMNSGFKELNWYSCGDKLFYKEK